MENDLFSANFDIDLELTKNDSEIHLRIQQRNGRKCITIIEGMKNFNKNNNLEKITKELKQKLNCRGTIKEDGNVVEFSGDQRNKIKEYLISNGICPESKIKIHGF
jgi:translation initiation factor 1